MANEIVTRQEAKEKHLKRYFTGLPCKYGHRAERITVNGCCLTCRIDIETKYRGANPEKFREKWRNYERTASPERRLAKQIANKKYETANREKVDARINKWRAENPDKIAAYGKKWRDANPDKVRKKNKAYRAENAEHLAPIAIERTRHWRKNNPDKVRENSRKSRHVRRTKENKADGSYTNDEIRDLLVKQNCQCASCSISLLDGKELDHIFPISRGGSNWIYNLQWLCIPCNRRKRDRHPLEWLREIGRIIMTDDAFTAKVKELTELPTDEERLAAYHTFVKQEWQELTSYLKL